MNDETAEKVNRLQRAAIADSEAALSPSGGSAWLDAPTGPGFWWYHGSRANDPTIYEVAVKPPLHPPGDMMITTFHSGDWYLSQFLRVFEGGKWQRVADPR